MTTVRAKFVVVRVTRYEAENFADIELAPRYSTAIPEDQRFSEFTPNGGLQLSVTNPNVIKILQPGKVFYIDINEAPAGTKSTHE